MARKRALRASGTVVVLEHASQILADNPLGDPHVRRLAVWLPAEYDDAAGARPRPAVPGALRPRRLHRLGPRHVDWKPFGDNVPERVARLVHAKRMGPAIVVFPDCFTSLGGNQYVNSSAIGRYADYLTRELIPFVDREFRTLASREHRGCFGKSSGGYGAIIHGMKYAKHWGAVADHSGDAYFDFVYGHDWPNTLNELAKYRDAARASAGAFDVRAERRRAPGPRRGPGRRARQALPRRRLGKRKALAGRGPRAHERVHGRDLRPGPGGAARLPPAVQPRDRRAHRGALEERGAGTIRSTSSAAAGATCCRCAASTSTAAGATSTTSTTARRILSQRLAAAGIAHTYEEFDDNHSDIDYRMDVSLPFLYRALKP